MCSIIHIGIHYKVIYENRMEVEIVPTNFVYAWNIIGSRISLKTPPSIQLSYLHGPKLAILISSTNYLPKLILSCTYLKEVNSWNLILLGVRNVLSIPVENTITSEYFRICFRDSYPCSFRFKGNQVTYIHVNHII